MGRRFLAWWESLAARRQVQLAMPTLLLVLFGVHEAFFPLLDWTRSLMYSVMWAIPFALVVVFATQVEVARRAREAEARRAAGGERDGRAAPEGAGAEQPERP